MLRGDGSEAFSDEFIVPSVEDEDPFLLEKLREIRGRVRVKDFFRQGRKRKME